MNEDPLVKKMNNLRGYIQAAREASMMNEVSMLESNLRMLKQQFRKQAMDEFARSLDDWVIPEASNPLSQVLNSYKIVVQ